MQTRSISYIDPNEDLIELEVNEALKHPLGGNLNAYFEAIAAQCAMLELDVTKPKNSRKIYFIEK